MLTSMTGFGRAERSELGYSASVELKSVNSRYNDISLYLPQQFRSSESQFKDLILTFVQRGKINATLRIESSKEPQLDLVVNPVKLKQITHILHQIKEEADLKSEPTYQDILQFKEIFDAHEEDEKERSVQEQILLLTLKDALKELNEMRKQEGSHLAQDLLERMDHLQRLLSKVEGRASQRIPELRTRLQERLSSFLEDDQFDKDRMEMEIAIQIERLDITEEIVRLNSHLKFFKEAVESEGSVGRRLNFLSQEMNREINTIGSKCNDSSIAQDVVLMKEILENIREQIQNIE